MWVLYLFVIICFLYFVAFIASIVWALNLSCRKNISSMQITSTQRSYFNHFVKFDYTRITSQ